MIKHTRLFIAAASLTIGATAFAATYNPSTGYVGTQENMQSGDSGVSAAETLIFNVSGGNFVENTTYNNANVRIDQLKITDGSSNGVTIFTGAVTGAGAIEKTGGALPADFVFSGNMQGYAGNISIASTGGVSTAIKGGDSVLIYGGVTGNNPTAGGTLAQGAITTDATGKWINNVAGSGSLTVNNVVFNYGTDSAYDYVKVTNQISAGKAVHFVGDANTVAGGVISGTGVLNKSGTGTLTLTGNNTYVGSTTVTNGTLDLTSGKLYANAHNSVATVTVNTGATVKLSNFSYGGSLGNLDDRGERRILNGGTFEVTGGTHSSGNNFQVTSTGGTFRYATAETGATLTLAGNGNGNIVAAGALTFDTNANIVVNEIIQGAGALNKTGTGTLTFGAANTYTGATTVSQGRLLVNGSIAQASSVSIATGASLAGSGTVTGNVTAANGANITAGNGTAGSLTLGNLTFQNTGSITIGALSNYTDVAAIKINGALSLNGGAGSITLNLGVGAPLIGLGSYRLISGLNEAADLSRFTVGAHPLTGPRLSGALAKDGGSLVYVVSGDMPRWTGAAGSEWSTNTIGGAGNWALINGGTSTDYLQGDEVLFDDTAVNTSITIAENVSPIKANFNNSAKDYVISGAAGIAGATSLVKDGSGTLTINTANTYTGGTVINDGTLRAMANNALGTGIVTLNAGTLQVGANNALGTNAITVAGGRISSDSTTARTLSNAITFTDDAALGHTVNNGALTLSRAINLDGSRRLTTDSDVTVTGVISNGTLVKDGAGRLTLSAVNTYTGGTTVNEGTLRLTTRSGGTGTIRGTLTANAGTTIEIGGEDVLGYSTGNDAVRTINLNGATLVQTMNRNETNTAVINMSNGATIAATGGSEARLDMFGGSAALTSSGNLTNTVTSNLRLRQARTIITVENGAAATDLLISGNVTEYDGNRKLEKHGAGTLVLTGNNTYSDGTEHMGGTLAVNALSGIGSGYLAVKTGAEFRYDGQGQETSGRILWIDNGAATFNITDANAGLTFTNTTAGGLGGDNGGLITKTGAGSLTFAGVIRNGGNTAVAVNNGTLTLTGSNAYSKGTTVTGGTLVTGNASALGRGDVNVVAGTLQIGDGTNNAVTLGAGADLLLGDGAVLKFFGEGSQITLAGDGSYTFGNAALDLNGAFNAIGVYDLIIGGNVNLGTQGELTFLNFAHDQFSAAFNNGQLHVSAIPEPSTYGLMGAGALGAVALVRRRRKAAAKQ